MLKRLQTISGFTLIELLAVLTMMGIVAAVVVPQIGNNSDLRLAAASRTLMSDIGYAQSLAINTKKKQYIRFSDGNYAILSRTSDSSALTSITHPVTRSPFTVAFSSGNFAKVSLASISVGPSSILAFDELGAPMAYNSVSNTNTLLSSPGTIRIQSGSSYMTISIEPYTGEVSISAG